jgi:4-hydroxy-2-oxoheptanedioate aldolase
MLPARVGSIGCVLIGEGDLSQELGFPRQYDHPIVKEEMGHVVATCKKYNVPAGHPHVTSANVERVLAEGYRFIMAAPVRKYDAIEKAKEIASRK